MHLRPALVALVTPILAAQGDPGAAVLRMGTLPGLRYEFTRVFVRPGVQMELVVENRDSMMHNLVITKPGRREAVVLAALALGPDAAKVDYVPPGADVLWSIGVIEPQATKSLRFTTPTALGEYPYVCTYPGHGFVMFGTMVVTNTPQPPVESVLGAPVQEHHHAPASGVVVRRMFLPDAGPAAIAVSQPDGLSFCWDAGACRLRYAWAGGPITKVKMGQAPELTGPVEFRAGDDFPLRVGGDPTAPPRQVRFLGYRVDPAGAPTFEYEVDGVRVNEHVVVTATSVVRTFRTDAPAVGQGLWFAFQGAPPQVAPAVAPQQRGPEGHSFLPFAPNQAGAFAVTQPKEAR